MRMERSRDTRSGDMSRPCTYVSEPSTQNSGFKFLGYLKGKSSLMIYEQFGNLKFKYRNREFWCRGYYVDTVGKNKEKIAEYIKHQLDEDRLGEQMTMLGKDDDPFRGGK